MSPGRCAIQTTQITAATMARQCDARRSLPGAIGSQTARRTTPPQCYASAGNRAMRGRPLMAGRSSPRRRNRASDPEAGQQHTILAGGWTAIVKLIWQRRVNHAWSEKFASTRRGPARTAEFTIPLTGRRNPHLPYELGREIGNHRSPTMPADRRPTMQRLFTGLIDTLTLNLVPGTIVIPRQPTICRAKSTR